jgi:hypothetical protein
MSQSRREFLRMLRDTATAVGVAGASSGLAGCVTDPETTPEPSPTPGPLTSFPVWEPGLLPAKHRPRRTLEVFLWGGVNPHDSFYVVPEFGDPSAGGEHSDEPWMWWAFQDGPENIPDRFAQCGGGNRPLLEPWRTDAEGRMVHLGPFAYPLRDRPDILARMRLMVTRHGFVPHEGGVPLMLTGTGLGNPRAAATATHVEAWMQANRPGERTTPWSYVIYPDRPNFTNHNATASFALGLHRPSARPLGIRMPDSNTVAETLPAEIARTRSGPWTGDIDRAVELYAARYQDRLRAMRTGEPVRSVGFQEFLDARLRMSGSQGLEDLLNADAFAQFAGIQCGDENPVDMSRASLDLAAKLLTDASAPASYVTVVDPGLITTSVDSGYDTHEFHVRDGSRNLIHTLKQLASLINEPDENDPNKLDLDRDTILLTTEFGRTPFPQGETGLNHWPNGFVVAAIGGWVDEERSGVVGAIDVHGNATEWIKPSELRAAILLSMGIWPFANTGHAVGDVRGAETPEEAATRLREVVLGYPIA